MKLTILHYKAKLEALEREHNITQYQEEKLHQWRIEVEKATDLNTDYPKKPFFEPFEYQEEDYDITELYLDLKDVDDIKFISQTVEGVTEITFKDLTRIYVKESPEEVSKLLES